MRRFLYNLFLILLLLSFIGCKGKKQTQIDVITTKVQKGEFYVKVSEIGTVSALKTTRIVAPFYGKINYLAPEGYVKKGQILVKMDIEDLKDKYQELKLNYKLKLNEYKKQEADYQLEEDKLIHTIQKAKADLNLEKLKLEDIKKTMQRTKRLVQKEILPRINLDEAILKFKAQQSNVKKAKLAYQEAILNKDITLKKSYLSIQDTKNQLEKIKLDLNKVETKIKKSIIISKVNGIIIHYIGWRGKVKEGDQVWNGYPIMDIPDLSKIVIELYINELDVAKIKKGLKANIVIPALNNVKLNGYVYDIGAIAQQKSRFRAFAGSSSAKEQEQKLFKVKVLITSRIPKGIKPGMSANVDILVDKLDNVKYIPIEAVFIDKKGKYVYKKSGNKFKKVYINLGPANDNLVVLKSQELKANDEISLQNLENLNNKQKKAKANNKNILKMFK